MNIFGYNIQWSIQNNMEGYGLPTWIFFFENDETIDNVFFIVP